MHALLVEDDPTFALLARRVLEEEGFTVHVAPTAAEAITLAERTAFDCVILDLSLPDGHGLSVVETMRKQGRSTPVMVLTGDIDRQSTVRLLDAGADDYVTKPVDVEELQARIRALIRRGGPRRSDQIVCGNVILDRLSRQLFVGGTEVSLTAKELPLLEHLMLHSDEVISRADLLREVWDMDFDPGSNIVDVNVARIRRKLSAANADIVISARRGVGFVLKQSDGQTAGRSDGPDLGTPG